eukprot:4376718-Alexandrium_andersonii.AAC.1
MRSGVVPCGRCRMGPCSFAAVVVDPSQRVALKLMSHGPHTRSELRRPAVTVTRTPDLIVLLLLRARGKSEDVDSGCLR